MGITRSLTPMMGVVATLAAMTALPGCGLILDLDTRLLDPPDTGSDDGSGRDAGTDAWSIDAFDLDAHVTLDDASFDADLDAWVADAGVDAGSDGGPPDSGPPDSGSDAGPPEGCTDGTVEQPYPGRTDIVGCDGAVTQCMAATLCDAGWHLCTWDEYQARGGATQTATTFRWIASVVRDSCSSITPMAPTNTVSARCIPGSTATLTLQYACTAGMSPSETIACSVGVAADTDPIGNHIGLPGTPCSKARIMPVSMSNGATCCR